MKIKTGVNNCSELIKDEINKKTNSNPARCVAARIKLEVFMRCLHSSEMVCKPHLQQTLDNDKGGTDTT